MNYIKFTIVLLLVFLFVGCKTTEERLTRDQWLQRLPPPDTIEKGEAMAILETKVIETKAKMAAAAGMEKLKIYCVIGFIASIVIIALKQRTIGGIGVVASLSGFCLTYAGTEYADWIGKAGLAIILLGVVYAIIIIVGTLKKVIRGDEEIERIVPADLLEKIDKARRKIQRGKKKKKSTAEKVVERIRNAL